MRRSPRAKTRLRRQSVSLFPFLAVLICTMGALIVLLVVIAQQAQLQATRDAIAKAEDGDDDVQLCKDMQDGLEMADLMVSQLRESHRRTEAELRDARFALGQVEENARRLAGRLRQLQATLAALEKAPAGDGQLQRLRRELEAIEGRIIQARRRLDNPPPDKIAEPASYAILPYEGAHGTNRRPIYIECLADAIVIQPEGIRLTETDFIGPLRPGNPLDVALRATREYLATAQGDAALGAKWEPYPLLLVRPSGIMAYYMAREAMASWGSEIGYELIDEDWPLEFPEANPALAAEVEQAVAIARRRTRHLAALAPSRYGQSSQPRFAVSPNRRGLVPLGPSRGAPREGFGANQPSDPFGRRFASPATGSGHTPFTPASTSAGPSPVAAAGNRQATEETTSGRDSSVATTNHPAGYPDTAIRRPDKPIVPFGQVADGLDADQTQSPAAGASTPGGSAASRVFGPTSDATSRDALAASAANAASQAGAPSGENSNSGAQASSCSSLARIRGHNWGLSDQASGSIPLSRPIRVECYGDRLVVVPDEGTTGGQIIALKDRTEDTIDTFVSALWDHMSDWKNAGQGMHWRPTLNVYVADDARNRFADLNVLLEGSGLTVKYAGKLRAESWRTASRPERER